MRYIISFNVGIVPDDESSHDPIGDSIDMQFDSADTTARYVESLPQVGSDKRIRRLAALLRRKGPQIEIRLQKGKAKATTRRDRQPKTSTTTKMSTRDGAGRATPPNSDGYDQYFS